MLFDFLFLPQPFLSADPQILGPLYPLNPIILLPHPSYPSPPSHPPPPTRYKIFINYPLIVTQIFLHSIEIKLHNCSRFWLQAAQRLIKFFFT